MKSLQTKRSNINDCRLIDVPSPLCDEGQVRVAVERFSFTANNVTYAVAGDFEGLSYWRFFPCVDENGDDASQEWGHIPVWGFANVTESKSEVLDVGDRLFGYFPTAQELIIKAVSGHGKNVIDTSSHRADLPPFYNVYHLVDALNDRAIQVDNERSLLYPLFRTGYALSDFLQSKKWMEADQVIIVSASSKTSLGMAYAVRQNDNVPTVVGLTSTANVQSVTEINLYDEVVDYAEIENLDSSKSCVIVDMSGNQSVISRLHTHFNDNMLFNLNVGITHWQDAAPLEAAGIIVERSEMFFAPGHIQEMLQRMGEQQFYEKSQQFLTDAAMKTRSWLKMRELDSLSGLASMYEDAFTGKIAADQGIIIVC